jgi:glycerol-3-phosphate dehydrogenase
VTFERADALARLEAEPFDVLVVGGGITGTGVALDAATRGLRTALVERADFASGTSSKSSKLVHGGLRYLQQREIRLVYEALAERQVLRKTAPHLVRVLPFLLPVFTKDGLLPRRLARALGTVMWMYDATGGVRIGKLHKRVSPEEARHYMPTLPLERLAASYVYYDAQADDARLTLAVARAAADHGATLANYTAVTAVTKGAGQGRRARVRRARRRRSERDRRVVRRRACARRRCAPGLDPAREGRAHHGAVVTGAEHHRGRRAGAERPPVGVRRAVGRVHLHRDHRHRLRRAGRRPAVHAR